MIILYIIIGLALLPIAFQVALVALGYIFLASCFVCSSIYRFFSNHKKITSFLGNALLCITFFAIFIPIMAYFDK